MEGLTFNAIAGLVSAAILAGVAIAAKETIGNIWVGICLIFSIRIRKGKMIEAKVHGEVVKGRIKGFSLSRMAIEDDDGNQYLVLNSDLKKATIKVYDTEREK